MSSSQSAILSSALARKATSDTLTAIQRSADKATKSAEIFVCPRSKRAVQIPTRTISGFERVKLIKVLGVTISRKFSVAKHVDELLTSCGQSLFAVRTLRQHGLPTEALQAVFQAINVWLITQLRFPCVVGSHLSGWSNASGAVPSTMPSARI